MLDQASHKLPQGSVIGVGHILGKKSVRTDEPSERVDTKILRDLVQPDAGQGLSLGLRVDSYGQTGTHRHRRYAHIQSHKDRRDDDI